MVSSLFRLYGVRKFQSRGGTADHLEISFPFPPKYQGPSLPKFLLGINLFSIALEYCLESSFSGVHYSPGSQYIYSDLLKAIMQAPSCHVQRQIGIAT